MRYLNINDKLADAEGRLFDGMMNERDKLHPTLKGYQVWADALRPLLHRVAGPARRNRCGTAAHRRSQRANR